MNLPEKSGRQIGAEHYRWAEVCDGWHLLKRADLSVIEERVPPGGAEIRHRHAQARQYFYILAGAAGLAFDGREVALSAGEGIEVPPGLPHRFINASDQDVRFLVISAPSTAGDRENLA